MSLNIEDILAVCYWWCWTAGGNWYKCVM